LKRRVQPPRAQIASALLEAVRSYEDPGFHVRWNGEALQGWPPERLGPLLHLVEVACLLDPSNPQAAAAYNLLRWDLGVQALPAPTRFWRMWRCSEAWKSYVERFGLAAREGVPFVPGRFSPGPIYLRASQELVNVCGTRDAEYYYGLPSGLPPATKRQWWSEAKQEDARRQKELEAYDRERGEVSRLTAPRGWGLPLAGTTPTAVTNARPVVPPLTRQPPEPPPPRWPTNVLASPLFQPQPIPAFPPRLPGAFRTNRAPTSLAGCEFRQIAAQGTNLWVLATVANVDGNNSPSTTVAAERGLREGQLWQVGADGSAWKRWDRLQPGDQLDSIALDGTSLWLSGSFVARVNLQTGAVERFDGAEGQSLRRVQSLSAFAGRAVITGERRRLLEWTDTGRIWREVPIPVKAVSESWDPRAALAGNSILLQGFGLWLHRGGTEPWTNLGRSHEGLLSLDALMAAGPGGFWLASQATLARLEPGQASLQSWSMQPIHRWQAPAFFCMWQRELAMGGSLRMASLEQQLIKGFADFEMERAKACKQRRAAGRTQDAIKLRSRLLGAVSHLLPDGDFLWVVLDHRRAWLLHTPTLRWVGGIEVGAWISALTASANDLWLAVDRPEPALLRLGKEAILAVPANAWVANEVPEAEVEQALRTMPGRQQAVHAFFAGQDKRVVELLGNSSLSPKDMEAAFLLACSHDSLGLRNPVESRRRFEAIMAAQPDSPWAEIARRAMLSDAVRAQELALQHAQAQTGSSAHGLATARADLRKAQAAAQMDAVVRQYDQNGDRALDRNELEKLRRDIGAYKPAGGELPVFGKRAALLSPLLFSRVPTAEDILLMQDADHDGMISAAELIPVALQGARE
jgi:hypothetical protein